MHPYLQVAFWQNPLTQGERSIIYYFLVIAGLALLAMFVRTWNSLSEVSPRFRPALLASLGVVAVATISYVVLVLKFDLGYTRVGGDPTGAGAMWMPNKDAIWSWAPRYMDWSVTVPMLMAELIGVSALVGAVARRVRIIAMVSAFLMIFTGYLGGVVLGDGNSLPALWTWGIISGVFMVVLYVVIIYTVLASRGSMGDEAMRTYRLAMVLQLVVFFAYPVIYGFQGYTGKDGAWTVTAQITLSIADVLAKVLFGSLIHKIAKLRTAEDVVAGEETHPESVWASEVKQSDAVLPPTRTDLEHAGIHRGVPTDGSTLGEGELRHGGLPGSR